MSVNSTCINKTRESVSAIFINVWTGVSSIVAVIWLSRSMYKQRHFSQPKFLSLAVCFCDLLYAAISNSQVVAASWLGYCVLGGDQGCIIRGFSRNSTMVASHLMVVLMAMERFIALRFPFRYQHLLTPRKVVTVAVSLYIYSIFLATLPLMGVNKYGYGLWCDFHWNDTSPAGRFFVIFFLIQGFGCMLLTVYCNISVIYELLAIKRRVGPGLSKASFKEKVDHFKFMAIMAMVSIFYIICSTPYLIRLMCNQFGIDRSLEKDFQAVRMYIINNMTNSYLILFIQVLFHPKVIDRFRACCCAHASKENDTTVAEMQTSEVVVPP
ncbi:prostaglandin E2 receptor EP2 subtype-like [Saccostrea echinata]|uniref:prostaglandin E2 receptor EP2 subtype-like n=1 Tax=Saccostrea echinata TaxID=191078 RepID=UPI002A7F75CE|nr:prostaglandin E2 receptor EP2 subtype-like [Saccostrea echinata]